MIKFRLFCKKCSKDFDSWFASSKEYEKLKKSKLLNCPKCNSYNIKKSLMAPSIINNKKKINNLNSKKFNFLYHLPKVQFLYRFLLLIVLQLLS